MPAQPRDTQLIRLIEQTYEAALDPALWPAVTLTLAGTFGGGAAGIVINDPINRQASLMEAANFHPDYVRSYETHYGRASPWVKEFLRFPVGSVLHRGLVPELELESTEYYNDWLKPQGLRDCLGGVFDRVDTSLSYIAVLRLERHGEFPDVDHQSFRMVLANMRRALSVHAKLAQVSALKLALFDALDRTGLAAFAVAEDLRLLGHNTVAESLSISGAALRISNGKVAARDPAVANQLAHAVLTACRARQGRTVILPQGDGSSGPLVCLVMPMAPEHVRLPLSPLSAGQSALILVRDPSQAPRSNVNILRQLFGLTTAEARLMGELSSGKSLEEISEERNVRYGTLRAQLRAVMSKTDTRRQGALVALATRHTALNVEL